MMTNNISLYFHIPFCVKKCDYCAFYSLANGDEEIKQKYFEALIRQIDFFETDKTVSTVYFGGGTPPMIGIDRLCSLITRVLNKFTLAPNYELTVEINPKTIDFEGLLRLKAAGANRLSVGVQASDDGVLKAIGRIHSFTDAENCINDAKRAGFNNISADIIFALPFQTQRQFVEAVNRIADLNVNHISAYSLQLEEGTPLFNKKESLVFPDEDSEEEQYESLCQILKGKGFEHYEISSFCKSGFESRHNLNYWARGEYFGFGAAAHSFFENKRFSAEADVKSFIEKSYTSLFAPTDFEEAEVISQAEAKEEQIMLGLRTNRGVIVPQERFSVAERIANLGYGSFENGRLVLNSKGFRVSNEIIGEILV